MYKYFIPCHVDAVQRDVSEIVSCCQLAERVG